MPPEKAKILEYKHDMKPDWTNYIIYADLECLIKKIGRYKNNPEKSSRKTICKHIQCGYSMPTIWRFNHIDEHRDKQT